MLSKKLTKLMRLMRMLAMQRKFSDRKLLLRLRSGFRDLLEDKLRTPIEAMQLMLKAIMTITSGTTNI
jgi:hypothetical protein